MRIKNIVLFILCLCVIVVAFQTFQRTTTAEPQVERTASTPAPAELDVPKLTAYEKLLEEHKRQQSIKDAERHSYEASFEPMDVQLPNAVKCGDSFFDEKLVKHQDGNEITLSFDGDEITVTCNNK